MATKVFIVDHYNIFREGLRLLIGKDEKFEVVGQTSDPEELFTQIDILEPDIIVLNLTLKEDIVLSVCRKLDDENSTIKCIAIVEKLNNTSVTECLFKVASGIVWEKSSPKEFLEALNTVISGKRFFNFPGSHSANDSEEHKDYSEILVKVYKNLSAREQEVFKCFGKGLSYKEIGTKLEISPRTVESHKKNILDKLELNSLKELMGIAIKSGIV